MSDLTPDDVRRWDAAAVLKVFHIANIRASTLQTFGEDLDQTGQLLAEWEGGGGVGVSRQPGQAAHRHRRRRA